MCWGYGGYGQLGNGKSGNEYISGKPVAVSDITSAKSVVAGENHTCALLSEGTISCWGSNSYGQLGNGKTDDSAVPVTVTDSSGSPVKEVATLVAGTSSTCAALTDGTALCWGNNASGQLGNGKTDNSPNPVKAAFGPAIQLAPGEQHTCGRDNEGVVACWGQGYYGQLGTGATDDSLDPVKPKTSAAATTISSGETHSCAVINTSNSIIECWGYNYNGQLGDGSTVERDAPVQVRSLQNAFQVSGGAEHSCALVDKGTAYCWGYGAFGQLGDGTTGDSAVPTLVYGF
jgi:alpha-tubulin suppressor-like RCC1 family protein